MRSFPTEIQKILTPFPADLLVIRADLRYNKESTPSMKCIEMGENKFMQKKALLALLLVLTMILSGCSLIVKDEAVDAARVVIRVGDDTYTKAQVQAQI